jgi:putative transposase
MFGKKTGLARRSYQEFVEKGIGQGRRKDLTGGGLIRSAGGWEAVKAMRKDKVYQRSDERILGDGDFVGLVFSAAEEEMKKSYALKARGFDLAKTALRVSEVLEIKPGVVWAKGRFRQTVEARSLFCYWAVRELGVPMSILGRKLGISIPSVSKSVIRGQAIADSKGFSLL